MSAYFGKIKQALADCPDPSAEALFNRYDQNSDGKMSTPEFEDMLRDIKVDLDRTYLN